MEFGSGEWRSLMERLPIGSTCLRLWMHTYDLPEEQQETARDAVWRAMGQRGLYHLSRYIRAAESFRHYPEKYKPLASSFWKYQLRICVLDYPSEPSLPKDGWRLSCLIKAIASISDLRKEEDPTLIQERLEQGVQSLWGSWFFHFRGTLFTPSPSLGALLKNVRSISHLATCYTKEHRGDYNFVLSVEDVRQELHPWFNPQMEAFREYLIRNDLHLDWLRPEGPVLSKLHVTSHPSEEQAWLINPNDAGDRLYRLNDELLYTLNMYHLNSHKGHDKLYTQPW